MNKTEPTTDALAAAFVYDGDGVMRNRARFPRPCGRQRRRMLARLRKTQPAIHKMVLEARAKAKREARHALTELLVDARNAYLAQRAEQQDGLRHEPRLDKVGIFVQGKYPNRALRRRYAKQLGIEWAGRHTAWPRREESGPSEVVPANAGEAVEGPLSVVSGDSPPPIGLASDSRPGGDGPGVHLGPEGGNPQ